MEGLDVSMQEGVESVRSALYFEVFNKANHDVPPSPPRHLAAAQLFSTFGAIKNIPLLLSPGTAATTSRT